MIDENINGVSQSIVQQALSDPQCRGRPPRVWTHTTVQSERRMVCRTAQHRRFGCARYSIASCKHDHCCICVSRGTNTATDVISCCCVVSAAYKRTMPGVSLLETDAFNALQTKYDSSSWKINPPHDTCLDDFTTPISCCTHEQHLPTLMKTPIVTAPMALPLQYAPR